MKHAFVQKLGLGAAALLLAAVPAWAQTSDTTYTPTPDNLQAREQFQDNKFGIFIHWGLYSMTAQGEWYMNTGRINRTEYAKLAAGFCPSRFDAARWVEQIKATGAKYVCFTTRHHDGFSMFGTKASDYNIVDATPYGRDVLKALAEECHKQGLKLHLYYSHLDWTRDDYPSGGSTGAYSGRPKGHGDWPAYYRFMNAQLTELLTNYGPIGAIWFDGMWDRPEADWQLEEQYALIHRLQPACLVGNNHHRAPYAGEDFQLFERDLPGENKAGLSGQAIGQLPLETCETTNRTWGYNIRDLDYKSPKELIHYLVKAAGKNANLLMNVAPQPNGELPEQAMNNLQEVGRWLDRYGETIYGTRGGDVSPHPWGVSTRKGSRLFIHILDLPDSALYVPLQARVKRATRFVDGKKLTCRRQGGGVLIELGERPTSVDHVVELTLE